VHCFERSTGKEVWAFLTRARVDSSPLIVGNRVFVGSSDGILYELDLAKGGKTWEFTAGAPLTASPAAAQGALVIGSQDGVLYCFGSDAPPAERVASGSLPEGGNNLQWRWDEKVGLLIMDRR
jgi:outer membrane protein assembly factor BamB